MDDDQEICVKITLASSAPGETSFAAEAVVPGFGTDGVLFVLGDTPGKALAAAGKRIDTLLVHRSFPRAR